MRLTAMRALCLALILALGAGGGCASAAPVGALTGNITGDYLGGRLAARVNALSDAARVYASAQRAAPDDPALLKDAFFYHLAIGDHEAARRYAANILARYPDQDDGLARLTLVVEELRAARTATARDLLQGEFRAIFLAAIARLSEASILAATAGPVAALNNLREPPSGAFTGFDHFHVGIFAAAAGEGQLARLSLQRAIGSGGGLLAARALGAVLERDGDAGAASEFYALLAAEGGPSRRAADAAMARLAARTPSREFTAVTAAEGAAAAFYVYAQAMIGQAASERERLEQAGFNVGEPRFTFPLVLARLAIRLDPSLDEARRLAGGILNVYGDFRSAAEVLSPISVRSAFFEQSRIEMSEGLIREKRFADAERLLKDAVRRDRKGRDLKFALANLYAQQEQRAQALSLFNAIIDEVELEQAPANWRYFVARGANLIEMNRWRDAEADLKRAVALSPEEPTALNYLGYSWAERGENLDEAFSLLQKAVAAAPQSGAIVDSIGWAQYQLGRYADAVVNLERAASLEPSDPTITDHLGDAYWRLGRIIEARYQWRHALELSPPDKLKNTLIRKIADGLPADAPARTSEERR